MVFSLLHELLDRFADYPPDRIRLLPAPGTATKQDVIDIERAEGKLCELIDGVLVEKAVGFKESFLATRISILIGIWLKDHDCGIVLGADGSVELFPNHVRIPDVAFYDWSRLPERRIPDDPIPEVIPDLAVEVLSRSNTQGEMTAKLKDYFFAGVRLVWYVDPRAETVEVFTSVDDGTTLARSDTLDGGDVLPGFTLVLSEMFKNAE